jgi:hypothetical protein
MEKPRDAMEMDNLFDLIINLKSMMHDLNHWFYQKSKTASAAESILQDIWDHVHHYRTEQIITEKSFTWESLNQIAMLSFKMSESLLSNDIPLVQLTQRYMELRQYCEKLEKSVVRQKYYLDTGRTASQIGTISWAAKQIKKSEITVRRKIAAKKIWALQITKFWWIPLEEIQTQHKVRRMDNEQ